MKERRSSVNILSDLARKSRERRQTEAPYWRVGSGEQGSRLHGWSQEKKYYSEEGFREVWKDVFIFIFFSTEKYLTQNKLWYLKKKIQPWWGLICQLSIQGFQCLIIHCSIVNNQHYNNQWQYRVLSTHSFHWLVSSQINIFVFLPKSAELIWM